ncbi:hypothetical protein [Deinococcus sp.]|uniref:hypothetical protein n=1 Tax=Deinococcus sp. TaxID=47478 RepID=UPI003C7B9447
MPKPPHPAGRAASFICVSDGIHRTYATPPAPCRATLSPPFNQRVDGSSPSRPTTGRNLVSDGVFCRLISASGRYHLPVFELRSASSGSDRPRVHYTARRFWVNDSKGLIYGGGVYYLFHQHNPQADVPGHLRRRAAGAVRAALQVARSDGFLRPGSPVSQPMPLGLMSTRTRAANRRSSEPSSSFRRSSLRVRSSS